MPLFFGDNFPRGLCGQPGTDQEFSSGKISLKDAELSRRFESLVVAPRPLQFRYSQNCGTGRNRTFPGRDLRSRQRMLRQNILLNQENRKLNVAQASSLTVVQTSQPAVPRTGKEARSTRQA